MQNQQELEQVYTYFKINDEAEFKRRVKNFESHLKDGVKGDGEKGVKAVRSIPILAKIARGSKNYKEFQSAVEGKDMPAVKLTSQEMEMMKGGWFSIVVYCLAYVVGANDRFFAEGGSCWDGSTIAKIDNR